MTTHVQYPAVVVGGRAAGAQGASSWQLQRPLPPRRLLQLPHKDAVGQPISLDHGGGTLPPQVQASQPRRLSLQRQPAINQLPQAGFATSPPDAAAHNSLQPIQAQVAQHHQQQRQQEAELHPKNSDILQTSFAEPSMNLCMNPGGQAYPRPPMLMAAAAWAFAAQAEDGSGMGYQESDSTRSTTLPSSSESQGSASCLPEMTFVETVHEHKNLLHGRTSPGPPMLVAAAAASAFASQESDSTRSSSLPSSSGSQGGAPELPLRLLERPGPEIVDSNVTRGLALDAQLMQENDYLKQNLEYLRNRKHQMEHQVEALEGRVHVVEMQRQQYKTLYEECQSSSLVFAQQQCSANSEITPVANGREQLEIVGLQQQITAIQLLKDALNAENLELQKRNQALERSKHSQVSCVICMDNLANVVCMPCKHLAMCSYCSQHTVTECSNCPICRGVISDRMLIYMP